MASGHLIDDAARPREPVLALARHPLEDLVAFTGTEGKVRLHRMAPRGGRLKEGDDKEESAVREFEHMATPLYAVALSADGTRLACGGQNGEIRLFLTESGKREATIPSSGGPIFTLAFHPQEHYLAAAGSDGQVRFYNATDGHLMKTFGAVPLGVPGALEVPVSPVK
jgi:WD40 repeat protein